MSIKVSLLKNISSRFGINGSRHNGKSWKEIPGPSSLPIIHQTHHFLPGGSLYDLVGYDLLNKLYEDYGPITTMKQAFMERLIVLLDADAVSQVVRGENWRPARGGLNSLYYHRQNHSTRHTTTIGVELETGEAWKKYRTMINPYMLLPKTVESYRGALEEVAEVMIKRLKSRRDDQNRMPENLNEDMILWTLECVSVLSFGKQFNFLDLSLAEDSPQMKLMEAIKKMFYYMNELEFKPGLWKFYPTKTFKEAMAAYDGRDKWTGYFIEKYREEAHKEKTPIDDDQKPVFDKLVDQDVAFAEEMVSGLLTGANEAISTTMNGLLYCLAKNPDKQDILRDSLYTNEDNKKYLKACLKESLRVIPVSNFLTRQTSKPYNLLGYDIPVGSITLLCNNFLAKSEKHFPQADKYIPERWLVDADHPLSYKKAHPFAYAPFGYGVRICLGLRVVNLQIETLLENIIKNFRVEWNGPPPKITHYVGTTCLNPPFRFLFKDM